MISSDVPAGDEARRPGPIGIVVSSGPPRATVPDVRGLAVDDALQRLDGSFESDIVEEGSETAAPGTVLRQSPGASSRADPRVHGDPDGRARTRMGHDVVAERLGQVRLRGHRGDGAEGKWRIVVDLRPRYLIFGSGSATVAWEGTGAGHIGLDSVGSDEVAPLSGAGTYRIHVHPHGSVSWTVRVEQYG